MAREKDERKINDIFEATSRLVLEYGLAGLKMSEVAKKAGLATGTVYIYFKTKEDLINQLYLSYKKAKHELMMKDYDPDAPFVCKLEKLWMNYFNSCLSDPLRMVFLEVLYRSPLLTVHTQEHAKQFGRPVTELLLEGQQLQLIRELPLPVLMAQLISPIHEVVKLHYLQSLSIPEALVKECFLMGWNAVRK